MRKARRPARWLPCLALLATGAVAAASPTGDFLYHAQPRDTLIGIARRLLLDPRRWHDLQILNHIAEPRRIPRGSVVRIPYEWVRLTGQVATVVAVAGSVQSSGKKVAVGDVLPQGSVVETGADGSATLDFPDGSVVTVQKSSVLRLDEMVQVAGAGANSIRLKLDDGRIESKVKPHRDVGRFEIVTPVAVSAVRGTEFRNSFAGADLHATAETLEGTVAVGGGTDAVAVGAGFGTRIERGKPPLKPVVLLPPPDLAQIQAVNSAPALRIQLPPVPGARKYRVQLSADPTFRTLMDDELTSDGAATIQGLPDADYWLRARSIDDLGIEGVDAVRKLTQHVLPEPPVPTNPRAGSKLNGGPIHLEWTGVGRAGSYALQLAGDSGFAAPLMTRERLAAPMADVDDLPPGTYFWRVAAVNSRGEAGSWSDVQAFTRRAAMPMPDVPRRENERLIIGWPAVESKAYRLQISRRSDFSNTVLDAPVGAAQYAVPRLRPGSYFARVQAIDADGTGGPFSPPRRFAVPIPAWVKIAAPVVLGLAILL
jgi:hypothetical protein